MSHSFEGTTLALQHYYDIVGKSRKFPLMTVYQADEQPFAHRMAVWMASYGDDFNISDDVRTRLDEALLKNRKIDDPHVLRVLDYGTSEGHSFVVTDAVEAVTLRAWLLAHGPIVPWQALRLLDQLTGIVLSAHRAGFYSLCISTNNIFVTDTDRFEILTGPLGIGFTRAEILEFQDVAIVPELVRHIPPWSYGNARIRLDASVRRDDSRLISDDLEQALNSPDQAETDKKSEEDTLEESVSDDDSVQELDAVSAVVASKIVPSAPQGFCEDVYDVAAVIYEALCGMHPYFGDDGSVCSAALELFQASPVELSRRVEIDEAISQLVMDRLKTPQKDSLTSFLAEFAAACGEQAREKARTADKLWMAPPSDKTPVRKRRRAPLKMRHSAALIAAVAAISMFVAGIVTWNVAGCGDPIDLFAIPEIIPAVPDGIDIVISPRGTIPPETSLYLTSLDDGTLIRLGSLPFIYRSQARGAKLSFVIADESGHTMQLPVSVQGTNGLMVVPVDISW